MGGGCLLSSSPELSHHHTASSFLPLCTAPSHSHVFSDAAAHIQQGESPYARTTYRYTPFLAALLARFPHREWGRYLFCVADAVCGWIICLIRRRKRSAARVSQPQQQQQQHEKTSPVVLSAELQDALWWLYNPLAINICTRGSAESLVVLLPVLVTVWILSSSQQPSCLVAIAAGLCHGVAIHAKLYPIIYTLSFMTALVPTTAGGGATSKPQSTTNNNNSAVSSILWLWIRRLLTPAPLLFGVVSLATFVGFTWAAVHWYGDVALQEGLLYHFSRVDHRHNYSMHWYWIYLARGAAAHQQQQQDAPMMSGGGGDDSSMALAGRLLLVPQLVLLAFTSLGVAPRDLSLALFVQTFLFVAHNKVVTAQYFAWYLCLLPLCSDQLRLSTRRVRTALLWLTASILLWLGSAYCLEMQGMAVHRIVWMASVIFFVANVNLLGALLASSPLSSSSQLVEGKQSDDGIKTKDD